MKGARGSVTERLWQLVAALQAVEIFHIVGPLVSFSFQHCMYLSSNIVNTDVQARIIHRACY